MSKTSFFQEYSQRENFITNYTMLLFRHYYSNDIKKFNNIISSLSDDTNIEFGLEFNNQIKESKSVPDASIIQSPINLYFEVKIDNNPLGKSQVESHCKSIEDKDNKGDNYLICLTTLKSGFINESINKIKVIYLTFKELVKKLEDETKEWDSQLSEILEDYIELLKDNKVLTPNYMFVAPMGITFDNNYKHRVFYESNKRNSRGKADYIGYYKDKNISYIGKIECRVVYKDGSWTDENDGKKVGKELEERINKITSDFLGTNEDRIFLVGDLIEVNYKKTSKGGMQNARYINLDSLLKEKKGNNFEINEDTKLEEIAELLKDQTWE